MTERERLIELLTEAPEIMDCPQPHEVADHLLANGVIVPPCKVGDTVYYIEGAYYNSARKTVRPIKVTEISWKCDRSGRDLGFALIANGTRYKFSSIGKTVFLTKEEAEKALERSREK